jgi:hypothetical protein
MKNKRIILQEQLMMIRLKHKEDKKDDDTSKEI